MPTDGSLKRLGGGRWETRDGRFAIEPQSGTWVVVDNRQTDDLGLPLVRGPFGSLTAAREAIQNVRTDGPAESPLGELLKRAQKAAAGKPREEGKSAGRDVDEARKPREPDNPEPPPEPKWLLDLAPADRRRARELIARLEKLEVSEPDEIARAEIARDQPAVARLALERSLRKVLASTKDPGDAVRAAIKVIVDGRDRELGTGWRLVDDQGRRVEEIDLSN